MSSSDGALIASVQPGRLVIYSALSSKIITTYRLPQDAMIRCKHMRWSRLKSIPESTPASGEEDWLGTTTEPALRILLSDKHNIRVYDPSNPSWKATITSASANLGTIADVTFGFSYDEVLVFSQFGLKLTIWSLATSRGVEIRDPKYSVECYSFRPKTGHLALLTRGGAQDMMLILKPRTHELLRSVELSTVDAQEVAWSPDGRWIAVSDAAGVGYKVLIYTADGQLFKTWIREREPEVQLGVKSMMWIKDALAVGDYNDGVVFLKKDTVGLCPSRSHSSLTWRQFTLLGIISHVPTIPPQGHDHQRCWEEQINADKERSYTETLQSVDPPRSETFAKANVTPRRGVSVISFNLDDSMVATKSDSWPTTVWIWSVLVGQLVATLIHHSPVKHVEWHPKINDMVLVHCAVPEPVVHIWRKSWIAPKVLSLPLARATTAGKTGATWLQSTSSDNNVAIVMLSSFQHYATARISIVDGQSITPMVSSFAEPEAAALSIGTGPEDMFDEGHSLDFSPVKISNGAVDLGDGYAEEFGMTEESVDDTFHYRRNIKAGG